MVMVVDKPPIVGGDLPPLPPFLRKRRDEPERKTLILPDICSMFDASSQHVLRDYENNWKTTIYHYMNRIVGESVWDPSAQWEAAHSSSRRYRQWLETYHYPSGIPPHIQFGGEIKSIPGGDPTCKDRWEAWARATFF